MSDKSQVAYFTGIGPWWVAAGYEVDEGGLAGAGDWGLGGGVLVSEVPCWEFFTKERDEVFEDGG